MSSLYEFRSIGSQRKNKKQKKFSIKNGQTSTAKSFISFGKKKLPNRRLTLVSSNCLYLQGTACNISVFVLVIMSKQRKKRKVEMLTPISYMLFFQIYQLQINDWNLSGCNVQHHHFPFLNIYVQDSHWFQKFEDTNRYNLSMVLDLQ